MFLIIDIFKTTMILLITVYTNEANVRINFTFEKKNFTL